MELPLPIAVAAAHLRIAGRVRRTPVLAYAPAGLSVTLHLKCESLQRTGSFKLRGATNALVAMDAATRARGVATHSSGNHAAALAAAARDLGVPAHVVMPETAPAEKRALTAGFGAEIVTCAPTLAAREAAIAEVIARTGASLVHPYDDERVLAGQGTAALELLEDAPGLDALVVPVSGGGLLSGTLLAAALFAARGGPKVPVFGVEPEVADDAGRSLRLGARQGPTDRPTIADGLRAALSDRTFAIARAYGPTLVTVSEAAIEDAVLELASRAKLVVEPSGAVGLAAVRAGLVPGARVGVVLSGGNVDLAAFVGGRLARCADPR